MRARLWWCGALVVLAGGAHADDAPVTEQKVAPTAFNQEEPEAVHGWGTGEGRSYWVPASDIVLFDTMLNLASQQIYGHDYEVTWDSVREHLTGKWVYDNDPFTINKFGHPYQGSMYHGFARSAGLDYWRALGYTFLGSAAWEIAGETTPPSINDQWTTSLGGSFLGEPLFRMASLLLQSDHGPPGLWHSIGAALISPATGANRLFYGDRFDSVFPSHDPAVCTRYQLGYNINSDVNSDVNRNPDPATAAIPQSYKKGAVISDFTISYGLPGKPGYAYTRPFDYFQLQFTATNGNALENLITRGTLAAWPLGDGRRYRGIAGLYGTYDYLAPQIFRVSTTGFGLGTTGQWWMSQRVALQHELVVGGGYGSGGVIHGSGERDYHNGLTPQGTATLRWIFSDRVAIEATGREYYISDIASDEKGGSEHISRGDAWITVRIWGLHGLTLKYAETRRRAHYETLADTTQAVSAISLGYTYLGHRWFGAVDWRPDAQTNKQLTPD